MTDAKLTPASSVSLRNSVKMPRLGFGVYLSPESKCTASCVAALGAGYRHIDTAQYYENEKQVGDAVHSSGLKRSDVFLTTKVLFAKGSVEESYQSLLESVDKLDGKAGYVDSFLVHSSSVGAEAMKELWLALERLYKEGRTKSIGVGNYGIGHIERMKEYATIWPPHVNQIEMHPWCQQKEIDNYCQREGIVVEAHTTLVRNSKASDQTLVSIAEDHGVSTTQVLVRYSLQKGWVPFPKSDTPSRIVTNAEIFNFELSKEQMNRLNALDEGALGSVCYLVSNE